MSQISPPIRIVLVGAVLFLAAWFTVLKPKPVEDVPAAAPTAPAAAPVSKPGEFKAKAQTGAAQAEASAVGAANAGIEDDAPATAPPTAAPSRTGAATQATPSATPSLPALSPESLEGLPKPLRTALDDRKIVVLGVLNTEATSYAPMADDDRAVRNMLRDVNRYDGGVVVRTAPISRLAKYDGLLMALQVTQSPTVVVVDRNRRAVALEGYVDRGSVNQAIADARDRSVATRIKDPYLRRVNDFCASRNLRYSRFSLPTVRGAQGLAVSRLLALSVRDRRTFGRVAAPKRWRGLKRQMVRDLDGSVGRARLLRRESGRRLVRTANPVAAATAFSPALDRRINVEGLTACAANRTR